MLEPRRIVKFFLFATVLYAAFTWPWAAREAAFSRGFRAAANLVFSRFWFWPQGNVTFLNLHSPTLFEDIDAATPGTLPARIKPPEPKDVVQDTLMILQNRDVPGAFGLVRTSSRPIAYWPIAVVISLVLATPISWVRKLAGLLLGTLLASAFVALRVTIVLLSTGFADGSKKFRLFSPGPWVRKALEGMDYVSADNPTFSFVAAVFIWLVVVFVVLLVGKGRAQSDVEEHASAG